ncbi:Tpr-related protein family member, putative [Theileria annulata]|uniref:Tpr-related protein family member, putative n=1 Tax=Theileria annulata TaxID=5874 RepID=Q4UBL9_THEAN|nr:Tpr-related protein family member, putative [Theileria annulata]CAI75782.1 Tpr-related protein family member, putative [Theileria annulata]|eukprot:XP_955258.1 Tpr-related protein family member, putative [Theileria annulata]
MAGQNTKTTYDPTTQKTHKENAKTPINTFLSMAGYGISLISLIFYSNAADSDYLLVYIDICVAIIISLVAAILWTWAYGFCTDAAPMCDITNVNTGQNQLTIKYQGDENAKVKDAIYQETPIATTGYYKYTVNDPKTKITYTFTLNEQLADITKAATGTATIGYGHILTEGFVTILSY